MNGLAENGRCFDCAQRKSSKTDAANKEVVKSLPIDNQMSTKYPRMCEEVLVRCVLIFACRWAVRSLPFVQPQNRWDSRGA